MWQEAFSERTDCDWDDALAASARPGLEELKAFLDWTHIKHCLLRPFFETAAYPLVEPRELLPSFEVDLHEYKELPGFSMVAFDRPLQSFREVFQYDVLHGLADWRTEDLLRAPCVLEPALLKANLQTFQSRLSKRLHEKFLKQFSESDICALPLYSELMQFLLQLERAHVLARNAEGHFSLCGIWASFPSDLDTELKRFGMKIGKFSHADNLRYECNRLFVYQFLMETYGFPMASERRTSAALFSRRLSRMGEAYLVRVLGQSDRTITTLFSPRRNQRWPKVEKIALVEVPPEQKDALELLRDLGFLVDEKRRAIILRVTYKQHKYDPKNVREDRALSVHRQEIIHPRTGRVLDHLNVLKDAGSMLLTLNDIVRGEYHGRHTYKRQEVITETSTHEQRLKVLHSWLSKHQHRLIEYSDDFFARLTKILDIYLMAPANFEIFSNFEQLHHEVWAKYNAVQQARKIKILEDLRSRQYKGKAVSYRDALRLMCDILGQLKFELVNYFDELVEKALAIGTDVLNDAYLHRNYVEKKDDALTDYGREVKKLYGRLVGLRDEIRSIRKARQGSRDAT
ncbi:hypothetical protein [Desulfovibrio aminophilus]|uniref:hypothetical protein n=1 Tax=Desulfovibrio aminophilus TaxID=81425 RepID=UPI003398081F